MIRRQMFQRNNDFVISGLAIGEKVSDAKTLHVIYLHNTVKLGKKKLRGQ